MTLVKTARKISEEEIQSLNIIPSSQRSETAVNIHPITRTVLYPVCHVTRLAKFRFAFTGDLLIGENETKPVLTVPMRTFLKYFSPRAFFSYSRRDPASFSGLQAISRILSFYFNFANSPFRNLYLHANVITPPPLR